MFTTILSLFKSLLILFCLCVAVPEKVWKVNIDAASEARNEASFESDERWWDQVELTKLILASNKLTTLSSDISLLTSLVQLDVS